MRVPQEGTRVYPGLLPPGILWEGFSGTLRRNAGLRSELAIKLLTEPHQGCGEGMGREEMKGTKARVCTEWEFSDKFTEPKIQKCHCSTEEGVAGGPGVRDKPELCRETLSPMSHSSFCSVVLLCCKIKNPEIGRTFKGNVFCSELKSYLTLTTKHTKLCHPSSAVFGTERLQQFCW